MRFKDRYKPKALFDSFSDPGVDPREKRAGEMAGLMGTGAQLAPAAGSVLGAIAGGMLGGPAGAGIGMGVGGAAGSLVGAGLQAGANEQTRPFEEAELKKQARLEAVQRLLGRYLP